MVRKFISLSALLLCFVYTCQAQQWSTVGNGRCFGDVLTQSQLLSTAECQDLCLRTEGCLAVSSEFVSRRLCLMFSSCDRLIGGTFFRFYSSFVFVTGTPSSTPTLSPTKYPSVSPTSTPTKLPTTAPSAQPTSVTDSPSLFPTGTPSIQDLERSNTGSEGEEPNGGLVVIGILAFFLGLFLLCLIILLVARAMVLNNVWENRLTTGIVRQARGLELFTTAPLVLAYFDLTSDIVFAAALTNNGEDYNLGVTLICCLVGLVFINGGIASWIIHRSTSPEFEAWRKSYPRHLVLLRFSSFFSLDSFAVFRSSELFNNGHLDIPLLNASSIIYVFLGLLNHLLEDIPVLVIAGLLHGVDDTNTSVSTGLSVFTSILVLCTRCLQLCGHYVKTRCSESNNGSSSKDSRTHEKGTGPQTAGPANFANQEEGNSTLRSQQNAIEPEALEFGAERKVEQTDIQLL